MTHPLPQDDSPVTSEKMDPQSENLSKTSENVTSENIDSQIEDLPKPNPSPKPKYAYNHRALADMLKTKITPELTYPLAAKVEFDDNSLTKGKWLYDVVSILLRVHSNQAMYDVAIKDGSVFGLIGYMRLSRLLNQNPGWIEWLYKAALGLLQWLYKLFGKTPKSEDIQQDVTSMNTSLDDAEKQRSIAMVEKRVAGMVSDVQKNSAKRTSKKQNSKLASKLSLRDYQDLFQTIYLPTIASQAQEDRMFAAQRVAGLNPLVIERITAIPDKFPMTNRDYQSVMGTEDSLERAIADRRLYVADYKVLEEIQPGTVQVGNKKVDKFICQPIALFAMESEDCPNRKLVPVAIQCYQEPSSDNPIFTAPSLQASDSARWAWQMAKMTVQIADANYHELISHLGRTHLWIEPIAIATYNQLPASHALGAILLPHLEGTLFINDSATKGLINLGGTVDKVAAGTLESSVLLSVKGAKGYPFSFNESALPKTLKARGVDDAKALPDYPYRDDALLLWNAIHEWVSTYLNIAYENDAKVLADVALQSWIDELVDPQKGQMTGIGESDSTPRIHTLNYLIEAVTLIIFTCSAQHAAVNFPQSSLMTYMPNMPLAGYCEAPQSSEGIEESNYFALLPALSQSEAQLNMTYLLGSVYYTRLGHYSDRQFTDARIQPHLQAFNRKLAAIELEIKARNEQRPTHYDALLPSKIPQSTNI